MVTFPTTLFLLSLLMRSGISVAMLLLGLGIIWVGGGKKGTKWAAPTSSMENWNTDDSNFKVVENVGAEIIPSGFGKFGKLVINMGMHDVSDKDFIRNGEY